MANKIGALSATVGLLTDVDSAARNFLGAKTQDDAGGEYVYLKGVASTAIGSAVTFGLSATSAFLTALTVTGAKGPVGIAMGAIGAGQFGWYQIYGLGSALFNGAAVAAARIFSASTGKVDDAVVTGDQIDGAIVAATVAGSGLGAVWLSYPFMNGLG